MGSQKFVASATTCTKRLSLEVCIAKEGSPSEIEETRQGVNRGSGGCRIREGRVRRIRVVILLLFNMFSLLSLSRECHGRLGWKWGFTHNTTTQHTPSPYQFNESDF